MALNIIRLSAVLAVAGIFIALWPSIYADNLFALHPTLMCVAYIGLMTEGIILAALFRHMDAGADRLAAIQQHAVVQLSSLASLLMGFYVIFKNKELRHKHHFTSLHGKVGLLTVVLSAASVLIGAVSFRSLGLLSYFQLKTQAQIKQLHRRTAACTWYLSLLTMQLVMPHHGVLSGWQGRVWQGLVYFLGFAMLVLLIRSGKGKLPSRYYGSAQKLL